MLPSERNNEDTLSRVRAAAESILPDGDFQYDFEHGQWWVTDRATGAQWSVVDTADDFDFEQVTKGDDE